MGREDCRETWPAALPIQLDAELGFEGDQPVPHTLLSNAECVRRRPNLSHARQFNKGGDLVRAEMRQVAQRQDVTTNRIMNPRINNYSVGR